jgi:hypothetical protein
VDGGDARSTWSPSGGKGGSAPAPFPDAPRRFFWVVRIYETSPAGDRLRISEDTAVTSRFYSPRTVSSASHCATARRLPVSS